MNVFFAFVSIMKNVFLKNIKPKKSLKTVFLENRVVNGNTKCALLFEDFSLQSIGS